MTTLIWTANRALHNYRMVEEGFCWEHGEQLIYLDDGFDHCSCGRSFQLLSGEMRERGLLPEAFVGKSIEGLGNSGAIYGPNGEKLTEGLIPIGAYWETDWVRPEEPIPIGENA